MDEHKVVIEQDLMKRVIVQVLKNQTIIMKGIVTDNPVIGESITDTYELLDEFED